MLLQAAQLKKAANSKMIHVTLVRWEKRVLEQNFDKEFQWNGMMKLEMCFKKKSSDFTLEEGRVTRPNEGVEEP